MKRIFMGASALILAIAGIAATKATVRVNPYYYQKGSVCQAVSVNTTCVRTVGTPCTYITTGGTHRNIFDTKTVNSPTASTCSNQLFIFQ